MPALTAKKNPMKYNNVKYGILLSREQLDFLKDDRQGFHRPKALDTFLSLAAMEPFRYEKKNFSADLTIGQFAISKVELAELWGCDRKTAQKMVDLFNEVGILSSVANNRTTIHTVLCLAFWLVDGQAEPIRNPNYRRNPVSKNGIKDVSDSRDSIPVVSNTNNSRNSISIGSAHDNPCQTGMAKDAAFEKTKSPVEGAVIPAVQGNAIVEPYTDSGSSHLPSHTFSSPFPSVADANDDEREENMPASPFGYGQLPKDYLEQLGEHYANFPIEADTPSERSIPVPFSSSPATHEEIREHNEITSQMAHTVSADQLVIDEDTFDKAESLILSSRND